MSESDTAKAPETAGDGHPGQALYVTDWDRLYEVNSDGGPWAPGQKKRKRPLEFVRWYVYGPAGDNTKLIQVAAEVADAFGEGVWAIAWGFFAKSVEIAAHQHAESRGYLLGRSGAPIGRRLLAVMTGFTQDQIETAIKVLTSPQCGWLQWRPTPPHSHESQADPLAVSPNSPNSPPLQERESNRNDNSNENSKANSKGKAAAAQGRQPLDGSDSPAAPSPENFDSDSTASADDAPGTGLQANPANLLAAVVAKIGCNPAQDPRQRKADLSTFATVAAHVDAGHLGDPQEAVRVCLTTAMAVRRECLEKAGTRKAIKSPLGYWVGCFKSLLEEAGHTFGRLQPQPQHSG